MTKLHEEDVEILKYIAAKLINEVEENVTNFKCDLDEDYEDMDEWDDDDDEAPKYTIKGRVRTYKITWLHPGLKEEIKLSFTPVYGTVSITTSGDWHTRDIEVGWGGKNKEIKIAIMKIFYKVQAYWEVETPRRNREKFINGLTRVFPHMFDEMLLGDLDDEEKQRDDN